MPELELTGDNDDDYVYLNTIMAFPSDEGLRRDYLTLMGVMGKVGAAKQSGGAGSIHLPIDAIETLLRLPRKDDFYKKVAEETKRHAIAGELLCWLVLLYRSGRAASLRQVIYLAEHYYKCMEYSDGKKVPNTDITCWKYWKAAKPVVHLWAAMHDLHEEHLNKISDAGDTASEFRISPPTVPTLLAVAEQYRQFGESFCPSHSENPEPLISANETWKIPAAYRLPVVTAAENLELPQWVEEVLSTYSKRQY